MTVLRLSLTSTSPGIWALPATYFGGTDVVSTEDIYGNAAGTLSAASVLASAGSLDLGGVLDNRQDLSLTDLWFGGTHLHDAGGLVTVSSYTMQYGPADWQTVTADGPWNAIKNIDVSNVSADALAVSNFVDVHVETGDTAAHTLDIEDAKRGAVTASGSTNLTIGFLSNEYTWSNTFDVSLGNGTNTLAFEPVTQAAAAGIATLEPTRFNTAPQDSLLDLTVGNGSNLIVTEEGSAHITLAGGADTVTMIDGDNVVRLGTGTATVSVLSNPPAPGLVAPITADALRLGTGYASILLSDANGATTPWTTIVVPRPVGPADTGAITFLRYGHDSAAAPGGFAQGDWSHLTLYLEDFAPGSTLALRPQSGGGVQFVATDAADGLSRVLSPIDGPASLAAIHVVWGTAA